ncbi:MULTISPECIES: LamG-like jellyroll fold domain-containing protein [unclassified Polaromonas]|uniref:LamG-like jellyroll fold domain-containing protein n=1 Tax=unclassified Polaromonas TaxID=2638319 RepID=UPI0013DD99D3|nr:MULTISPECIES: LamG-like jellyroll fold domain-containing protein [unclassified Polaromonas]
MGGTVVDIFRSTKASSCPWCEGNPIYPLVGGKVEPVVTGMSVGGQPLVFTYSSAKQAAAIAAGKTAKTFGTMPALGGLWESSLHRNLIMGTGGFGATLYRGNGQTVSFRYSGTAYIADADVNGTFTAITGGYRYMDAKSRTIETYNMAGQLTSWADAAGNTLTFSYSAMAGAAAPAAGYLQTVTDNNGRSLSFAYTLPAGGVAATDGMISSATDFAGRTISTGFDANGSLTQLTWPDTKVRQFVYENSSLPWALTGVVDERGIRYSTFTYDSAGRALSTEHAGGANKYSVSYTTPPQVTLTQAYDSGTQLTTRTHEWQAPAGVQLTRPNGEITNASSSNVLGYPMPTGFSQPAGSGYGAANNAAIFDTSGNLTSTDDFNGQRSCYAYDSSNRETARVEGLANTVVCPGVLPGSSTLPAGSRKTETGWHADWRLPVKMNQPLQITTTVYHGQPDPFNSNILANCTSAPALPNGKALPVVCKQVVQATTDADGHLGLAAVIDTGVAQRVSRFTYDAQGRTLTSTDPLNRSTTYTYYGDTSFPSTQPFDPNLASVSLLLHADGANGSTTFTDSSPSPKTLSAIGTATISTAQSKFGGSAIYFNGAAGHLSTPANASFDIGLGDFTVETWYYPGAATGSSQALFTVGNPTNYSASGLSLGIQHVGSTGKLVAFVYNASQYTNVLSTGALAVNSWYHVALVRKSGVLSLYLNGVLQGSGNANFAANVPASGWMVSVGRYNNETPAYVNGYLDDFRFTKGIARYSANFTPPSEAFPNTATPPVDPSAVGHTTGDLQTVTNAASHVTQFTLYDRAGRVKQMVDPKGVVTDTTYTPRGWVSSTTVTPPGGTARTTTYTYDNAGQLTGVLLPDSTALSYSYDAAHRLTGVTDAKGNAVTYVLDAMANKTGEQVRDPSGTLQRNITRVYDALNRIQQVTGASN